MPILPADVKAALNLLRANPTVDYRIEDLAAACGVARRTLQKHFQQFTGQTPSQAQRKIRLDFIRRELLTAQPTETVTSIATRCGIGHLGRFADMYRKRFGETPSTTLKSRHQAISGTGLSAWVLSRRDNRPSVIVQPFDADRLQDLDRDFFADEITAALLRNRWLSVSTSRKARYQLRGTIRQDADRRCRIILRLKDTASGRVIWADRWNGVLESGSAFESFVADHVAPTIERAVHMSEIDRAQRMDPSQRGAWELTMKALPQAFQLNASAQAQALELLGRAVELEPTDALPVALSAWCHAQRGTHHFTSNSSNEKRFAHELAQRATELNSGDPRVEALLGAAETLAHNLSAAKMHCERSIALDGSCSWGWMRSGFVHAYSGQSADAIECFQIANALGPDDPLGFCRFTGMGIAYFEAGRFDDAAHWWTRLIEEHPSADWANRFLAPAFALAGKKDDAKRSYAELLQAYPELTISEVRSCLPHTAAYMDKACNGLDGLGMRP